MSETITAEQYRQRVAHGAMWRKFGNKPTVINGERFDSKHEATRHLVLVDRQQRGEIEQLQRQVTFHLVINGMVVGKIRPDWTYLEDGVLIAEDAKGHQTDVHKLRWKVAQALYPQIVWRLS